MFTSLKITSSLCFPWLTGRKIPTIFFRERKNVLFETENHYTVFSLSGNVNDKIKELFSERFGFFLTCVCTIQIALKAVSKVSVNGHRKAAHTNINLGLSSLQSGMLLLWKIFRDPQTKGSWKSLSNWKLPLHMLSNPQLIYQSKASGSPLSFCLPEIAFLKHLTKNEQHVLFIYCKFLLHALENNQQFYAMGLGLSWSIILQKILLMLLHT